MDLLRLQKRMRSVLPRTENDASIAYSLARPVVSSVVNERSQNKWGISQGYRIQVGSPPQVKLENLAVCECSADARWLPADKPCMQLWKSHLHPPGPDLT